LGVDSLVFSVEGVVIFLATIIIYLVTIFLSRFGVIYTIHIM
jgi:hypothetical protein